MATRVFFSSHLSFMFRTSTVDITFKLFYRIRLKRTGSLCVDSVVDEDSECSEQKSISSSLLVNPWIFKVHQEGLKRHLRSSNKVVKSNSLVNSNACNFIVNTVFVRFLR